MSKVQSRFPLFLSVLSVIAVVVLGIRQVRSWDGAAAGIAAVVLSLYLLWLIVEARVARGEVSKGETRLDRGTLELYAAGRMATVLAALVFSTTPSSVAVLALGGLVFVGGVLFRLRAITELGRFYSHRVRVAATHRIIDSGPYRFVRHPAYTGMLAAHLGFVMVFFNWASLACLVGLLLVGIVLRIRVEEQVLYQLPGYRAYSRNRKRLIPGLW
jgi:protein-S-isoprenylcysteine O-methyltransferase Ste14